MTQEVKLVLQGTSYMVICGHQKIISALQKNLKNGKLSHAYLFSGPESVGKRTVALEFIKAIQCQGGNKPCGKCQECLQIEKNIHPDTIIFQKEGEIKIGEMREIQKKMNLKQYNSPYKILLLDHAENLNEEAANSLLKFLEEPGGETLIILITADIKAILPTIVSRCVVINFFPVGKKEMLEYFERIFGVTKQNFATGEAGASPPRYKEAQKLNLKELILYSYGRPGRVINWLKSPNEFLENKKTIEEFSKIIFSQSPAKKFQFISQFYRKKEDSLKLLAKLLILMQQLILIKIGREKAVFDRNLANLSKVYELDRIKTALLQIILARKLISHNVNLKLVLENMMLNL